MQKEFIQMRRERVTFAMMVGVPIMQLILFGYAINTNPKHLPTALLVNDHSAFTRIFVRGLENTDYFRVTQRPKSEREATNLLRESKVLFVVTIPTDFTRRLISNRKPQILVQADATDPVAVGNALAAIRELMKTVFNPLFKGTLKSMRAKPVAVDLVVHAKYNPEQITQYYIVPGLLGVILTMTMVMITSMAITREREKGTMESLLATPVRPLEVMIGKIMPYIIVGYIEVILLIIAAYVLFQVPVQGSVTLLLLTVLPFIAANLAIGLLFSSIAATQLQAVQMTFFYFLPSILLSGFLFPFAGMPKWAQWIGQVLPLTHFTIIVRGIMLKGNTFEHIWPQIWPIIIFMLFALIIAVKRYRQTLD